MHSPKLTQIFSLLSLLCVAALSFACVDDADMFADADTGDTGDDQLRWTPRPYRPKPPRIPVGATWGPCDNDDPWGCDGSLGVGNACARPVSDDGLNICVPQTWDPNVPDDCEGLVAPFGLGVRKQGSAYCVVDCNVDADCAGGMRCSAQSHLCAWIGD